MCNFPKLLCAPQTTAEGNLKVLPLKRVAMVGSTYFGVVLETGESCNLDLTTVSKIKAILYPNTDCQLAVQDGVQSRPGGAWVVRGAR